MIDFKNIVLTTDLSSNSEVAAPYAIELAQRFGATVQLVHVFEGSLYWENYAAAEGIMFDTSGWITSIRASRQTSLATLAASLSMTGKVQVIPVLLEGAAAAEILKFAKDKNVDCIVIATHGRTGFSHFLFGSVAERVVRLSPCPVLSIRPQNIEPAKQEMSASVAAAR